MSTQDWYDVEVGTECVRIERHVAIRTRWVDGRTVYERITWWASPEESLGEITSYEELRGILPPNTEFDPSTGTFTTY